MQKVTTYLTYRDERGAIIERIGFDDPMKAGAAAGSFVVAGADADWREQGAAGPGPAKYTVEIEYVRTQGEV